MTPPARRLLLLILLYSLSTGCMADPVVPPAGAGDFTIATYNVKNLFDAYDDPYARDEDRPPKAPDEVDALATVLKALDADVLALQEVESRGVLEDFNRRKLKPLKYDEVVLVEGNDPSGPDVALLTRFEVGRVSSYRHVEFEDPETHKPTRFSRDLLQVEIAPPSGSRFDLFVTHLKSQIGGERADAKRLAQAQAIRRILDDLLAQQPQARFVLVGDMNDDADSPTLRALIGGSAGRLFVCPAADAEGDDATHFPRSRRPVRFDYLLVSPGMRKAYVEGSAKVFHHPDGLKASDHLPVRARFRSQ